MEILPIGGIDKETAEEQFRNIQNITVIPLKFYEKELKDILQKYDETFGEEKMDIIEEIMNYTLSAHSYLKKYAVEKINNKGLEHIHICNLKYDDKLGLINEKEDDEIEFKNRCI